MRRLWSGCRGCWPCSQLRVPFHWHTWAVLLLVPYCVRSLPGHGGISPVQPNGLLGSTHPSCLSVHFLSVPDWFHAPVGRFGTIKCTKLMSYLQIHTDMHTIRVESTYVPVCRIKIQSDTGRYALLWMCISGCMQDQNTFRRTLIQTPSRSAHVTVSACISVECKNIHADMHGIQLLWKLNTYRYMHICTDTGLCLSHMQCYALCFWVLFCYEICTLLSVVHILVHMCLYQFYIHTR